MLIWKKTCLYVDVFIEMFLFLLKNYMGAFY